MLLNIQTLGYDYIQGPMGAWNFACFGATAGVLLLAWRERDQQMKQTATGALAAGLLGGISEPSLYGIHLRFKRIYPRMLVGCFVGGLIIGIGGGVTTNAFVFTSLLTIPAFDSVLLYGVAVLAAFFVSMALVVVSGYKNPEAAAESAGTDTAAVPAAGTAAPAADAGVGAVLQVASPVDGNVIALKDVPDPVFAGGTMGPGVGIEPSADTVYAPGAGTVVAAQPTGHAFGLVLDGGIELLIHVGIDTVNLQGEGFDVHVKAGQKVEQGTPLVTFDRGIIEKAGYSLVTPVIVMNGAKFDTVDAIELGPTTAGAPLLSIATKAAAAPA